MDLLKKMLVFEPNKRIIIDETINHEYLKELTHSIDNPLFISNINMYFETDENILNNNNELYKLLITLITSFKTSIIFKKPLSI